MDSNTTQMHVDFSHAGARMKIILRRQVLLLVLVVCIAFCSANNIYYVKPTVDGHCPDSPCHTFNHYLKNRPLHLSNSIIYFLQGVHTITPNDVLYLKQVNNLALVGLEWQVPSNNTSTLEHVPAIINCSNGNGFIFQYSTFISIANITVAHCGAEFNGISAAAIVFLESSNIEVTGVVVRNSTGFGLWMYNVLGNTQIAQSRFISNKGSGLYGGNIFLKYYSTEENCELETVKVKIQASELREGMPVGFMIQIEHSCNNIYITLDAVMMSENGGDTHSSSMGNGNLNIEIIDPTNATHISIRDSYIEKGVSRYGGGITYLVNASNHPLVCDTLINPPINKLEILHTSIIGNMADSGGGFIAVIASVCQMHGPGIELKAVDFRGNQAKVYFSSVFVVIETANNLPAHFLVVDNCTFQSGEAGATGFGISLTHTTKLAAKGSHILPQNPVILISNSRFINNTGSAGALQIKVGIYNLLKGIMPNLSEIRDHINVQNCTFTNNSGHEASSLIIAISDGSFFHPPTPFQVNVLFENVSFQNDQIGFPKHTYDESTIFIDGKPSNPEPEIHSTGDFVIFIYGAQNVTFSNCNFSNHQMTPIVAQNSKLYFSGSLTFLNNTGLNGGAIALYASFLLPKPHTRMYFYNNHAYATGGALYVKELGIPRGLIGAKCFIQPPHLINTDTVVYFVNNTATVAGDVLYGGYQNNCIVNGDYEKQLSIFQYVNFNYTMQTGLSIIASDPIGVCICDSGKPNCNKKLLVRKVFPGDSFNISAAVVGQGNGIVPGVVVVVFIKEKLESLQYPQSTNRQNCTNLTYTIFSRQDKEQLQLTAENPGSTLSVFHEPPKINIFLLSCPLGFNLSGSPAKCDCVSVLAENHYNCSISTQSIHRPKGVWIGYFNTSLTNSTIRSSNIKHGVILHTHCPLDYCKQQDLDLNLIYPDSQCELNHSGLLCGKCQSGLSLALGTSQCLKCSNLYLLLLAAFGLAGLILVVMISWCNLTVSEGTLSALILYANIIQVSKPVFLPQSDTNVLTVFVAWLNLDFGIQTCFYNGMNMYAKAWLQLIFPLYIWAIVAVMIVLSRYYITAARVVGQNAPKVLATLFLLSYAKLLRAVITIFSFTYVKYPDGHTNPVWLYDGNVDYLRGKHVPLSITAVLILIVFLIPYTAVVLCMQYLRRKTNYRLLAWVRRFKPVFDPYGGPYKDRYQFWTGLLLVVRVLLFLAFVFNSSGNPALNLLFIAIAASTLLCTLVVFQGVYKSRFLDILEASFLVNISVLAAATFYVEVINRNLALPIHVSIGVSLTTFTMTVLYHIYRKVSFLKGCTARFRKEVINSTTNDIEYRDMEQQPFQPPNPFRAQRLTVGDDGELLLVSDDS